jgi:lysophospholipase L1-like esterase
MACRGLVAVGDSITYGEGAMALGVPALGWAQWLARALDLPYTCYAVNGARTVDVLRDQLPRVRSGHDVATLYTGVNDVRDPGFDLAAYEHDLASLACGLSERAEQVLMLTLPHDLGRPTSAPKPVHANGVVRRIAERHGAIVADLSDLRGWELVLPDAVHPTPSGQLEMADRAARALGSAVLPSALVPDRRPPGPRYAATHARMAAATLAQRARERARHELAAARRGR